ncbi:MAG TPA: FAD-dependent monooxygenase [Bryobacteraceae bacterium]|nr:FAD-dependent monooxygenase [Bryobacteraceae bacterium]
MTTEYKLSAAAPVVYPDEIESGTPAVRDRTLRSVYDEMGMGSFCSSPVCIVGGGPAGLAAAIALSRAGRRVTVIDCATPPIDKACGEGLLPDSLAALQELGIAIPEGSGAPFHGIRFLDAHSCVTADFPNGAGVGIRRTVLHELLFQRAEDLGVAFLWGAKNVRLLPGGVSVNGESVQALVVGADGQNSQIRREAGLSRIRSERRRYGFRRHYRIAPWSPYVELYWGARCQLYITPVSAGELCVAMIARDSRLRLDDVLPDFPVVQSRLRTAIPVSRERGALSVTRELHRVYANHVVLSGDAAGSVDAITGEGMSLGFKQALALPQVLASGDFERYQRMQREISQRPRRMASLLLLLERHPHLRSRVFAALARQPQVFASLLAVHVGGSCFARHKTPAHFAAGL